MPLSDMMVVGVPRRAINLSTAITQELVSREGTTSMCNALVVRQVNKKTPSLFRTSADQNWERPKVVDTCVRERRLLVTQPFIGQIRHYMSYGLRFAFSARNASILNVSQQPSKI